MHVDTSKLYIMLELFVSREEEDNNIIKIIIIII